MKVIFLVLVTVFLLCFEFIECNNVNNCEWLLKADHTLDMYMSLGKLYTRIQSIKDTLSNEKVIIDQKGFIVSTQAGTHLQSLETSVSSALNEISYLMDEKNAILTRFNQRKLKIDDYISRISLLKNKLQVMKEKNEIIIEENKNNFNSLESDLTSAISLSQKIGEAISSSSSSSSSSSLLSLGSLSKENVERSIGELMENINFAQNSEIEAQNQIKLNLKNDQEIIEIDLKQTQQSLESLQEQQDQDDQRLKGIQMQKMNVESRIHSLKQRLHVLSIITEWLRDNISNRLNLIQNTIEQCTEVLWNIELAKACFTP